MNAAEKQLAHLDEETEAVTEEKEAETSGTIADKPTKRVSVIDRFTERLKTFLESAE
jgi:hypothetical protein